MADANHPHGLTPLATFERHHAENNARWSAHSTDHVRLIETLGALKANDDMTAERLKQGAQTFAKVQADLEALTKKIMWPITKIVGVVLAFVSSIAVPIIVLAWTASKYPDRGEFRELEKNVELLHEEATLLKAQMEREDRYSDLKGSVDSLAGKIDGLRRP